jgi:hypothetical protein
MRWARIVPWACWPRRSSLNSDSLSQTADGLSMLRLGWYQDGVKTKEEGHLQLEWHQDKGGTMSLHKHGVAGPLSKAHLSLHEILKRPK